MPPSLSPTTAADALPRSLQDDSAATGVCPPSGVTGVSAVRQDSIRQAEDELDDAIRDLKTLAALAENAGQIETAIDYTRRALAASRSRTPEHKDRLAREHLAAVEASLDAGADYFQAQGRQARERKAA